MLVLVISRSINSNSLCSCGSSARLWLTVGYMSSEAVAENMNSLCATWKSVFFPFLPCIGLEK